MSTTKNSELIGKSAHYQVRGMAIDVLIVEVRDNYGRVDLLIRPVAGTGETWVSSGNVTMENQI